MPYRISGLPIRKFIYQVLNKTVGSAARGVQRFSILFKRMMIPGESEISISSVLFRISIEESAKLVFDEFGDAIEFKKRENLWDFCLSKFKHVNPEDSLILEFGVWKGYSLRYFANKALNCELYGFDSFQGLSENWTGTNMLEGHFNLNGDLPEVPSNVTLVPGWFENTLPGFLNANLRSVAILHMDCDTYTPTSYVLMTLKDRLTKGTIIIFDEFFGYPNWRNHEYKAWVEFSALNKLKYKYIGYSNMQVAIEIQ